MAGNAFSSKYFREQPGSGGAANRTKPWAQGTVFPNLLRLRLGWRLGHAIAGILCHFFFLFFCWKRWFGILLLQLQGPHMPFPFWPSAVSVAAGAARAEAIWDTGSFNDREQNDFFLSEGLSYKVRIISTSEFPCVLTGFLTSWDVYLYLQIIFTEKRLRASGYSCSLKSTTFLSHHRLHPNCNSAVLQQLNTTRN